MFEAKHWLFSECSFKIQYMNEEMYCISNFNSENKRTRKTLTQMTLRP